MRVLGQVSKSTRNQGATEDMVSSVVANDRGDRGPNGDRSHPPQGAQNSDVSKLLKKSNIDTVGTKRIGEDGVVGRLVDIGANIPYEDIERLIRRCFKGSCALCTNSLGKKDTADFSPHRDVPIQSRGAQKRAAISKRSGGLKPLGAQQGNRSRNDAFANVAVFPGERRAQVNRAKPIEASFTESGGALVTMA